MKMLPAYRAEARALKKSIKEHVKLRQKTLKELGGALRTIQRQRDDIIRRDTRAAKNYARTVDKLQRRLDILEGRGA